MSDTKRKTSININNEDQKLSEFIWVQSRRARNVNQRMKRLSLDEKVKLVQCNYYGSLSEVPDKVSVELLGKVKRQTGRTRMRFILFGIISVALISRYGLKLS